MRAEAVTPRVRRAVYGALAYFVLPFDALADHPAAVGYTHALAAPALRTLATQVEDDVYANAT